MYKNAGCKTLRIRMVVRAASQVKIRIGKCNIEGAPMPWSPSARQQGPAWLNSAWLCYSLANRWAISVCHWGFPRKRLTSNRWRCRCNVWHLTLHDLPTILSDTQFSHVHVFVGGTLGVPSSHLPSQKNRHSTWMQVFLLSIVYIQMKTSGCVAGSW